jgi:hypothetical protein
MFVNAAGPDLGVLPAPHQMVLVNALCRAWEMGGWDDR